MRSHRTPWSLMVLIGVLTLLAVSSAEANPNSGITYHGRIIKPDGQPLQGRHVQFRLQIRTPGSENCLLFEELQTKDMGLSNGVFSLTINDGTGNRGSDSGHTLERVFQNRGSFASLPDCQGATSYIPSSADGRKFIVSFRDESMSSWEPLPATIINFVPLAIEARSLGGFNASHLLRVTDDGTANGDPASAPVLTASEASELKALAGGTSTRYMPASPGGGAALPSYPTLTPPISPIAGSVWYDSDAKAIKYFDGTNPVTLGSGGGGGGSGTVTSVTAGDGLSGGSFTVSGTISLPDVGTSGTYYKVVTDAKGRVTSGVASLSETDLPTISTAGKVSGSAITSGALGGNVSINTTGNIETTGAITSGSHSTRLFDLYDSDNTHRIRFQTPATGDLTNDYELTWPETAGSSGQVLTTNGVGVLSWQAASGAPTGTAGGDLDGTYPSPTLKEIVIAGTGTKISYDAKGRVTGSAALDVADIPDLNWSKITGGKPTTLTGYGITDAVLNAGGVVSVQSGDDADKPAPATAGLVYLAVDTQKIYRDNGTSWDVVASVDAGSGGTVTDVTASAPLSSSGGVTPNITISQATTSTNGYLSSSDWNTFNSKLGTALNEGEIWVGNNSNQAAPATPGGDVSMSNAGSFTVTGVRGHSVSAVAPTLSGQVLRYDDVATSYAPAFLSLADIRSTTSPFSPMFPNTSCTAAQTLNWSSLTDTLTCTPIAIGDSAVTFASKAANAVFAGPISGGAIAPSFRALVVDDIPNLNASKIDDGVLLIARGGTGSSNGSITGSGALTFQAGGADQNVTLTPSGAGYTVLNGNVGIGTTSPGSLLHVGSSSSSRASGIQLGTSYSSYIYTNNSNNQLVIDSNGDTDYRQGLGTNNGTGHLVFMTAAGTSAGGTGASTEKMRITATGNVGIGTASPTATFNVDGGQGAFTGLTSQANNQNGLILFGGTNGGTVFARGDVAGGDDNLLLKAFSEIRLNTFVSSVDTTQVTIKNDGKVGIGTTSPLAKLDVAGTVRVDASGASSGLEAYSAVGPTFIYGLGRESNGLRLNTHDDFRFYTGASGNTSGSERMRITAAGNVGIGTTSPIAKLESWTGDGAVAVRAIGATGTNTESVYFGAQDRARFGFEASRSAVLIDDKNSSGTTTTKHIVFDTAGSERMRISNAGDVGIGTPSPSHKLHVVGTAGLSTGTAWTNTSDIRLKDIRGPYTHGLDEILKLDTVRFNYKRDNPLGLPSDKEIVGFIAQDVGKVIPEAVQPRSDGYLELNVDPIHWAVVNAVKELYAKFTEMFSRQDERLLALEAENARLKEDNEELRVENTNLKVRQDQQDRDIAAIKRKLGL